MQTAACPLGGEWAELASPVAVGVLGGHSGTCCWKTRGLIPQFPRGPCTLDAVSSSRCPPWTPHLHT